MSAFSTTRVACYGVRINQDQWVAVHQPDFVIDDSEVTWIFGALKQLYFDQPVSVVHGLEYTTMTVPQSSRDQMIHMLMRTSFGEEHKGEILAQFKPVLAIKREGYIADVINEYAESNFMTVAQKLAETGFFGDLNLHLKSCSFLNYYENLKRIHELRHWIKLLNPETQKMIYTITYAIFKNDSFPLLNKVSVNCIGYRCLFSASLKTVTEETKAQLSEIAACLSFKERVIQLFNSEEWSRYLKIINKPEPHHDAWAINPLLHLGIDLEKGTDIPLPRTRKAASQVPKETQPHNLAKVNREFNYLFYLWINTHALDLKMKQPSGILFSHRIDSKQLELQVELLEDKLRCFVEEHPEFSGKLPAWFPLQSQLKARPCVIS